MTPEQERLLFERVTRLEDFADRICSLLDGAGQAFEMARIVAQQVAPPVASVLGPRLRAAADWVGQPPDKPQHMDAR
jgi:hypothetical protein